MNLDRVRRLGAPPLLGAAVIMAGCSAQPVFEAEKIHADGRFLNAVNRLAPAMADEDANGAPDNMQAHNNLWAYLEFGKMQQDAGDFAASAESFDAAIRLWEQLDEAASFSVQGAGNNVGAILTDERNRDYLGAYYDHVGANIAQVVNMLMLGREEEAAAYARAAIDLEDDSQRIAARIRAQQDQLDAAYEEKQAELDAEAKKAGEEPSPLLTLDEAFEDPEVQRRIAALEEMADPRYANGTNPYGFFVGAVAMLGAENPGEARDFANRLRATTGQDPLGRIASGRGLGDHVIVFFENGRSACRADGSLAIGPVTGVPLPIIHERHGGRAGGLAVRAGGASASSVVLTDVDALFATDFNDRLLEIWGRPILSQIIKVGATVAVYAALEDDDSSWDEVAAFVGALWVASARPDLRSWRTLPGEQAAVIVPRPSDGVLHIDLVSPTGQPVLNAVVQIARRSGPAFVFVRSTNMSNMAVHVDRPNRLGPAAEDLLPGGVDPRPVARR